MDIDTKDLTIKDFKFEVKQVNDDDKFVHFEGYASTFDNIDQDGDKILKGAFTESLKKRKPQLLWQHRFDKPLGIPVDAIEDPIGLFVKGKLPKDIQLSKEAGIMLKNGMIKTMSIGFLIIDSERKDGIREIKQIDLFEYSLVSIPANDKAIITDVKSKKFNNIEDVKAFNRPKEFEKALSESGAFSIEASKYLASKLMPQRESGGDFEESDIKMIREIITLIEKRSTKNE